MAREPRPAGIVTRGLCAVVDLCVVLAFLGAIYLGLMLVRLLYSPTGFRLPAPEVWLSAGATVVVSILYLTVCWATTGRTIGAVAMGLRVITTSHRLVRWPQAALRAAACVLFAVGLLWAAVDPHRRSLQDIVLRTAVVYDWREDAELVEG
ncbi:RDD family protein [Rhodococcus sp. D2-41]|uniref:RDD family protein n=1 Tax=Speluncibacter jeojiensis TaxID=2710754 RepID=A0A9X4LZA6_9ACTN|nr:RDD family protein [Rhodococcus sp. D2-41]MDG3009632.1 RDD family protein [Rhodococcus sp. D2-41]MDG3014381.1 RDD family protein [Corynebacteriales bacterium D3-21]